MAELVSLSTTDASNNGSDFGMAEGIAPSAVNNRYRAYQGAHARHLRDRDGYLTAAGTANALTLTINSQTAAAAAGERISFRAASTNTGATTINITPTGGSARGAVAIQRNGLALTGGELVANMYYTIQYDGTVWQLLDSCHLAGDGTVSAPGVSFGQDQNTGMRRVGADNLALVTAGADALDIDSAGQIRLALQPAFLATPAVQNNVTGNGAVYTVLWATEVYDQNADFASPTFTAPRTGRYAAKCTLSVTDLTAAMTFGQLRLVTSNRTYILWRGSPTGAGTASNNIVMPGSTDADMDTSDTASIDIDIRNGAGDTADIGTESTFSMRLAA